MEGWLARSKAAPRPEVSALWPSWMLAPPDALLRLPRLQAGASPADALPAHHRRDRARRGDDPRRPAAHGDHPPDLQRPVRLRLRTNRPDRLRLRRRLRAPLDAAPSETN